jgi:hypothetical protein
MSMITLFLQQVQVEFESFIVVSALYDSTLRLFDPNSAGMTASVSNARA